MLKNIFAIGAIVLLSATSAMAQQPIATQCAADVKLQCAGVQPGEGSHQGLYQVTFQQSLGAVPGRTV